MRGTLDRRTTGPDIDVAFGAIAAGTCSVVRNMPTTLPWYAFSR